MKSLIILGKGDIANKPMSSIKTCADIPGYNGEDVWTVATHPIVDAHGYLAMHGERNRLDMELKFPEDAQDYASMGLLLNNSISIMLLKAVMDCDYEYVRIAGCPMSTASEYREQRESLFMIIGYLRGIRNTVITWDNDIGNYNNYYSKALGIRYE